MSEEANNGSDQEVQQPDPLQQLESKFSTIAQQLEAVTQNQQKFQESLVNTIQPQQPTYQDDDDYDIYDGKKFAQKLKTEVSSDVDQRIQQAVQRQQQLSTKIMEINQQYPEVSKAGSDLQKQFIQQHQSLPKSLQETPEGYELAVARAVSRLGVSPKGQSAAEPTPRGSAAAPTAQKAPKAADQQKTERVKLISKLLGRDIESEDYNKRVSEALNRNTWGRYR